MGFSPHSFIPMGHHGMYMDGPMDSSMFPPWMGPMASMPREIPSDGFGLDSFGTSSVPTPMHRTRGKNDSVKFLKRLGSGVFGEVWKAEYKGQLVAAKVTECPTGFRADELGLLRRAQGEYTVRMIAEEDDTTKGTAIIMELCDGSLHDSIERAKPGRCEGEFLVQLEKVLQGLVRLHEEGIIFGDLKPDNLLLKGDRIVFADFGDARDAKEDTRWRSVHEMGWGSPMYHARPDVMKQTLTPASDMWMFAQTAIHLWSCAEARSNPSPMPSDIPLRELIQQCLSPTAFSRPTAQDALRCCQEAQRCDMRRTSGSSPSPSRRRASLPSSPTDGAAAPSTEPSVMPRRRSHASLHDYVNDAIAATSGIREDGIVADVNRWHSGRTLRPLRGF